MAVKAENIAYVKGYKNELGDCPFCHRALLVAETKKVPYTKELVDFSNKPQWIVDKYNGTVPVFKFGEEIVADSGAIVDYLEKNFPEPTVKPGVGLADVSVQDSEGRVQNPDWLIQERGGKFFPAFLAFLTTKGSEEAPKRIAFEAELATINQALNLAQGRGAKFFGGDHFNDTDASLAPKLLRHAVVALKHFKNFDLLDKHPSIQQYYDAVSNTSAWKNTYYSDEAILSGWQAKVESS